MFVLTKLSKLKIKNLLKVCFPKFDQKLDCTDSSLFPEITNKKSNYQTKCKLIPNQRLI